MALVEERWKGLKLRGATEPSFAGELSQLQSEIARLPKIAKGGTLDAYQRANEQAKTLDKRVRLLMAELDALDRLIAYSKGAVAGNVQALAQAQAACDELVRQDPGLDFDQSHALIEKSAEAYLEVERQRGLGTSESYQTAIALAQTAKQHLAQAQEAIKAFPERAKEIRGLLDELGGKSLSEWRERMNRVGELLRIYTLHWDAGLASDIAEAADKLGQVEIDLQKVPPDVRCQRCLRQSEVDSVINTLSHARTCAEGAQGLIIGLERERERIDSLRENLEHALQEISKRTIPAIREQTKHALPELQERFQTLEESFQSQATILSDPGQANYDEAIDEWLPSIERQLHDLLAEHDNVVEHYRAALKETWRRIERAWGQLSKLEPNQSPGPDEDIDQIVLDLEAWRADAERAGDDPLRLREVVGRRATALEQRIETAHLQIVEGRRALDDLDTQYHKCAQATRDLRSAVREMQSQSQWPRITWPTDQTERAWEEAIRLELESRSAPSLATATDQLQRGVSAMLRAEQLYARIERQMGTALRRLDQEKRSVTTDLERASHQAKELRERGLSAEMVETQECCTRAEQILKMAEAATTFEDALWHLRDASRTLNST